jgi:hypothetical protein
MSKLKNILIISFSIAVFFYPLNGLGWGFFAHSRIHYYAVFLLPPPLLQFYKAHMTYITEHATDPDRRRYLLADEGPRHYIDLDHYGSYPFHYLPRDFREAKDCLGEDSLRAHGIVPWQIQWSMRQLTEAFRKKDAAAILKYSADVGHYMADAHVPLHTSSNHNGQFTNQHGIHGFWESRVPELLATAQFDFYLEPAVYLNKPNLYIWERVMESATAVDSVLFIEKKLTERYREDRKFAFEERNGKLIKQYSSSFTRDYDRMLDGMVERRMRQSIQSVSSVWLTAWIDAGQPDLTSLLSYKLTDAEKLELEKLHGHWLESKSMIGRQE